MSKQTKWTPGPWRSATTDKGRPKVVDHHGFSIATAGSQPYNHADFTLMAAARELYDALEQAKRELEEIAMAETGEHYNNLKINSALAKSRGEQ